MDALTRSVETKDTGQASDMSETLNAKVLVAPGATRGDPQEEKDDSAQLQPSETDNTDNTTTDSRVAEEASTSKAECKKAEEEETIKILTTGASNKESCASSVNHGETAIAAVVNESAIKATDHQEATKEVVSTTESESTNEQLRASHNKVQAAVHTGIDGTSKQKMIDTDQEKASQEYNTNAATMSLTESTKAQHENTTGDLTESKATTGDTEDTAGDATMSEAVESKVAQKGKDESASSFADTNATNQVGQEESPSTRVDLMEAIEDLESPGSTCVGGAASSLPAVPGLHVEGVGHIPLPICEVQEKALAAIAQQAPHGRGTETVIDTSVRNSWQIEPNKVTIDNPAWEPALKKLVAEAATGLGVAPDLVKAELYKLLLYEPGGFFKKHRDTEKADGMFATLVVQLPSRHTGGALIVSHAGETKKFVLGSGENAQYGCQFVAHYADCEHEIEKVESGYRLALIYSLCYTGVSVPSAANVAEGQKHLKSVLRRLPAEKRIFLLPLRHQYTTASLTRYGLNALKGDDQNRRKAISAASDDSFKMMIVRAERIDSESGEGSYYGGFECYDCDQGCPRLVEDEAYGSDGIDCSADLKWIRIQVNFEPADEGGMLLASEDEIEDMWGEGEEGSVEYTGNEGATRETTYDTYLLLAYSQETELELMCEGDLSRAISTVEELNDPIQSGRVLAYLGRSMKRISRSDCATLLRLALPNSRAISPQEVKNLEICLHAVDLDNDAPCPAFDQQISSLLTWCLQSTDSLHVMSMLTRYFAQPTSSMKTFLAKAYMAARLVTQSKDGTFSHLLKDLVCNFHPASDAPRHLYPYGYGSSRSPVDTLGNRIISLVDDFGWTTVKDAAATCVHFLLEKEMKKSASSFIQTVNLLESLDRKASGCLEVRKWCKTASEAFVDEIMKPSFTSEYGYRYRAPPTPQCSSLLKNNESDKAVELLFKYGEQNLFSRLENWTQTASSDHVAQVETFFRRVFNKMTYQQLHNRKVIQAFIDNLELAKAKKQLSTSRSRRDQLLFETRSGPPVFSWSMQNASFSSNVQIQDFLRSDQSGPVVIVVGGGIANARRFARKGTFVPVRDGYSADIQNTGRTGSAASVRITKTRAFFDSQMKVYQEKVAELRRVQGEIAKLEGSESAAQVARPLGNVSQNSQAAPPPKKQRIHAPIPDDAEVITID